MNTTQRSPRPQLNGLVAGQKAESKIVSNKRTGFMIYTVRGEITLAGAAATTIFNGGSLASLLDFIGFSDAGDDRAYWPALNFLALTSRMGFSAGANVRLTTVANGVYPLVETIVMPFAWDGPMGSSAPWETCHLQPDPRQDSTAWVIPNLNTALLVDAGATISSPVTVDVTQVYDDDIGKLPFFIPKFSPIQQSIPGAVVNLPFYLKVSNPLRGIIFSQVDSVAGIVTDIITSVRLLDDAPDGTYIGSSSDLWDDLVRDEARRYGAAPFLGNNVATGVPADMSGLGTYFHNWQDGGRLSNIYNPRNAGNNLQLQITGQPSVVGGGSASVNAGLIELEQIPGKTAIPTLPDGRPIFQF